MAKNKTTEDFLIKAKQVHGTRYDYSKSVYVNNKTQITITCKEHGDFEQVPHSHLSGCGCKTCGKLKSGKVRANTTENFIKKAVKTHGNKYEYSKTIYKNARTNIIVICKKHGVFLQKPTHHLLGIGCGRCGQEFSGFTKSAFKKCCDRNGRSLGTLYVIKCFNKKEIFYKIGITSLPVEKRFPNRKKMPYTYEVLHKVKGKPEYIYELEKKLLSAIKDCAYKPAKGFSGDTECFADLTKVRKVLNF